MAINVIAIQGRVFEVKEARKAGDSEVSTVRMYQAKKKKDDSWDRIWFDVSCWGKKSELAQKLSKGDKVLVEGSLAYREWEQDGIKRSAYSITADKLHPDYDFNNKDREDKQSPAYG